MTGPRVLLMTLSERTSAKGTAYMSGWLGKARVVAFKSKEPDKYGNEQWDVFVSAPELQTRTAERRQRTWDHSRPAPRETAPGHVEAWDQEREQTPFYDDSRDLTEGSGR